ncbi:hypothetical protein SBRCBS47491_009426 [Sporothrix bragantina]|uniref:Uncharacterized protein n=1 Tax=Sporothrix bragantina TaxID=671064 RepID=A0ABP0CUL8_9PEZI
MHFRSQDTETQPNSAPQQPHQLPCPLNNDRQGRSPSRSPTLLPSPLPSTPSVTDLPKEVEQLAGELSRHHLQRTSVRADNRSSTRNGHHGSGRVGGRGSHTSSAPASRNSSRYRDAMANFSPGMAELRLRNGGNAPVADLEVDMDQDNRNDNGDCQLRLPSPSPLSTAASFSQAGPPSSYAVRTEFDAGPSVPLSLLRMRRRQAALADTSVRHLNLGLTPFPRQISPETDGPSAAQQATQSMQTADTATEMTPDMTDAATVTTTVTAASTTMATATSNPAATSTVAAALAAAAPIEADDEDLPPLPEDAMAVMTAMINPYPQPPSRSHSRSLSRSYHSQSISLSNSAPCSHPHSLFPSVSVTGTPLWSALPADCLPLSSESLAMPHLAPLHNDVPSSGYDLQGWLSSSSTVESTAALTTGTIDACSGPLSTDVLEVDDSAEPAPPTVASTIQDTVSNREQAENLDPVDSLTPGDTAALLAAQAKLRRQQSRQYYTAYLRPHHLPFYKEMTVSRSASLGPNPPVDALETDMDESDSITPEEPAPAAAPAIATATHGSSDKASTPTGKYMGYAERIQLLQKAMAREAERARSQQHSIKGSSTAGSVIIAGDDMMDVDMVDPPTIDSPRRISAMDGNILRSLTSLPESGEASDVHNYMGPFRYRLSSEVAMRCTNLVRNKPRMRRRRQPGEGSETNDGGSSIRGSSTKGGGSSLHSERRRERHRDRAVDRAGQTTSRDPSRDASHQDGREKRSRVSRRREQTRLAEVHSQALAHVDAQAQAQAQGQAMPSPSPFPSQLPSPTQPDGMSPPVPAPVTTTSPHRLRMEQFPLPAWRLPEPAPIEAIDVDTT